MMKKSSIYCTLIVTIAVWIMLAIEYKYNYLLIGGSFIIIIIFAIFFYFANKYDAESKDKKIADIESKIKEYKDNYKRFDEAKFQREMAELRTELKIKELKAEAEYKKNIAEK